MPDDFRFAATLGGENFRGVRPAAQHRVDSDSDSDRKHEQKNEELAFTRHLISRRIAGNYLHP